MESLWMAEGFAFPAIVLSMQRAGAGLDSERSCEQGSGSGQHETGLVRELSDGLYFFHNRSMAQVVCS